MDRACIDLQKSKRAKRLCLKLCPLKGLVLVVPYRTKKEQIKQFLDEQKDWIKEQEQKRQKEHLFDGDFGDRLYYLGNVLTLSYFESETLKLEPFQNRLVLFGDEDLLHQKTYRIKILKEQLKTRAEPLFNKRVAAQVDRMGLKPKSLSFKWVKTRWGSCSAKGAIHLNVCLMGAPLWVIDYVIIHELAHLKHMNHSAAFWEQVKTYDSDYKRAITWLKTHQYALMRLCYNK